MSPTDIIIIAALGIWFSAVVFFLVRRHIRNKKTGQISCCCSCSACPMASKCESKK